MFAVLSMLEDTVGSYQLSLSLLSAKAANFNTPGYKQPEYSFTTLFTQAIHNQGSVAGRGTDRSSSNSVNIGQGMQIIIMGFDMTQGAERSGLKTDAFISGQGFFVVEASSNSIENHYTRAGRFNWTSDGFLIDVLGRKVKGYRRREKRDPSGNVIRDANGLPSYETAFDEGLQDIRVDPTTVATADGSPGSLQDVGITDGGVITTEWSRATNTIENSSGTTLLPPEEKWQLAVATFSNPEKLEALPSGNGFRVGFSSGDPIGGEGSPGVANTGLAGSVVGGVFEGSNVDPAKVSVEGIQLQRGYNGVQSAITIVAKFLSNYMSMIDKVS